MSLPNDLRRAPKVGSEDTAPSLPNHIQSIGGRNDLCTLPCLTSLQLLPSFDRTSLDTDHILVSVERGKIANILRVHPRVPHNNFVQIISDDAELLLSSFVNNDWCIRTASRGVDSVCCAGNSNGCRWRGCGADWDGNFVDV